MTGKHPENEPGGGAAKGGRPDRGERLKAALRQNLKRRKGQARERAEEGRAAPREKG